MNAFTAPSSRPDNMAGPVKTARGGSMSAVTSAAHDTQLLQRTLARLPAGAYTCDGEGLITYFNQHALQVWGRAPALHDPADRYCGSFRLFAADGSMIAHDECWMALAIRHRREYLGEEIVVERPDGSRATVLAYATPVLDDDGNVASAINMLVNISERKRLEDLLRRASQDNSLYRATLADALREEMRPMQAEVALLAHGFPDTPAVAIHARTLRDQMERLSALIDELVDIAPREAAKRTS
jgi:PAS domain-containing protein